MSNLKQKAIEKGLCRPYQLEWINNENLIDRYITGITWCLERKYPALDDLLPHKEELSQRGVFVSEAVDLILTGDTYILNECTGSIEILDYNVSRLYVALNTTLRVIAKGNSILYIDSYDNSAIQVIIEDNAQVSITQNGNSSVQIIKGNATIKDKR